MYAIRVKKELKELCKEPLEGITLNVNENNLKEWHCIIEGPEGTPYYGYELRVKINLKDNYPLEPPKVLFEHSIYHPNVSLGGHICLDILKSQWAPTLTLGKVMLSISSLLNDPNPYSPLNGDAADNWKNNRKKYNEEVIMVCEKNCKKIEK